MLQPVSREEFVDFRDEIRTDVREMKQSVKELTNLCYTMSADMKSWALYAKLGAAIMTTVIIAVVTAVLNGVLKK